MWRLRTPVPRSRSTSTARSWMRGISDSSTPPPGGSTSSESRNANWATLAALRPGLPQIRSAAVAFPFLIPSSIYRDLNLAPPDDAILAFLVPLFNEDIPITIFLIQGDTMLSTSTELDVMMGERRPEVGKVGKRKMKSLQCMK